MLKENKNIIAFLEKRDILLPHFHDEDSDETINKHLKDIFAPYQEQIVQRNTEMKQAVQYRLQPHLYDEYIEHVNRYPIDIQTKVLQDMISDNPEVHYNTYMLSQNPFYLDIVPLKEHVDSLDVGEEEENESTELQNQLETEMIQYSELRQAAKDAGVAEETLQIIDNEGDLEHQSLALQTIVEQYLNSPTRN